MSTHIQTSRGGITESEFSYKRLQRHTPRLHFIHPKKTKSEEQQKHLPRRVSTNNQTSPKEPKPNNVYIFHLNCYKRTNLDLCWQTTETSPKERHNIWLLTWLAIILSSMFFLFSQRWRTKKNLQRLEACYISILITSKFFVEAKIADLGIFPHFSLILSTCLLNKSRYEWTEILLLLVSASRSSDCCPAELICTSVGNFNLWDHIG